MKDQFGREINYMRISVTDRCNLRCLYCMPHGIEKVPMDRILSYEQILEICRASVSLGIDRFKITGGEPLVRLGCVSLIKEIKKIPGVKNITLTTNGVLLADALPGLAEAGLDGINISLDTTDRETYARITGSDSLPQALKGIDAALSYGIRTKINCVLNQGLNEDAWKDLVLLAKDRPLDVRFIELMPIGNGKDGRTVYNDELLSRIRTVWPEIEKDETPRGNGPAVYYHISGFAGDIGFISAMHGKFCSSCNRIRLTSKGQLKTCLCYSEGADLMPALSCTDPVLRSLEIRRVISTAIAGKQREHHFEEAGEITEHKKMFEIGG